MKKLFIVLVCALLSGFANAQEIEESELSVLVKDSFKKMYRNPIMIHWERAGSGFKVDFRMNNQNIISIFDVNGNFKLETTQITSEEMPQPAQDYCRINYSAYMQVNIRKFKYDSGNLEYEVEMTKEKEHIFALFDINGAFMKQYLPVKK